MGALTPTHKAGKNQQAAGRPPVHRGRHPQPPGQIVFNTTDGQKADSKSLRRATVVCLLKTKLIV